MTRRQKLTLLGAVLALLTASVGGLTYLEEGRRALGTFMVVGSGVGWIVLLWRVRALMRERQRKE